jgi:hypothetical protein
MGNYIFNTIDNNTIDKTSAATIISSLSTKYNKTDEIKRKINNTKSECGHGCIFIGKLKENSSNLRMLVGAHYSSGGKLKIGVFGGGNEDEETVLDTVIREAIEEIFNFIPDERIKIKIKKYLNDHPELYFIFQLHDSSKAYSYIFDVDILSEFVKIIKEFNPTAKYLSDSPFNLIIFMKNRQIESRRHIKGLDEIKYLSFTSLHKLVDGIDRYELCNYNNYKRESLYYQHIFSRLLQTDIIKEIL